MKATQNIGILTLPFEPNYGFILQAYALFRVLKDNGLNPILLNRGWNQRSTSIIYKIKRYVYYTYLCHDIQKFFNRINHTDVIRNSDDLYNQCLSLKLSKIVVGSDQVWAIPNTRGVGLNYFFDFLPSDTGIQRYSYAASFGKDKLNATPEEIAKIKKLLPLFDIISVREDSGVEILRNEFGIGSKCVIDPTLLLSKDIWQEFILNKRDSKELVTYILDENDEKSTAISKLANYRGLKVHNLYNRRFRPYFTVEHWLTKICNAEFVVVDSFHGMVFAILFEKQFVVITNKKRGETRFISLLRKLGLEDRLIKNAAELNTRVFSEIDYNQVRPLLQKERDQSMQIINQICS